MYGPLIQHEGAFSMSINKVPKVPFAQIANAALRDKRLSYTARGILAHVLSNAGEWDAGMAYLRSQSDFEGQKAIQKALNQLTELGYRVVVKHQRADGRWESWVEWFHEPQQK